MLAATRGYSKKLHTRLAHVDQEIDIPRDQRNIWNKKPSPSIYSSHSSEVRTKNVTGKTYCTFVAQTTPSIYQLKINKTARIRAKP